MSLPIISNTTDARICAALTTDSYESEVSSGIDIECTRNIEGLDEFLDDDSNKNMLDECEERFYKSLMPSTKEE